MSTIADELPISWGDHLMNAELPKLNPQSVLDGYVYSVWLDEGVTVTDDAFMHLFMLKDTPALKAEYLSPEGISLS